jgi:C-terminal processing protease CtpA/Prc
MKKTAVRFAVILLFVFGQTAEIYSQAKTNSLTKEQWQKDLQYLAKELPARHKNAFHTVTREQFERAVAELNSAIPTLQEHEILVGLRRIVALVGDAHTALEPPRTFNRYPLTLYWFGNDLRVLRTTADYKRALGTRVVGIGKLNLAEATERINTLVSKESEQFVRYANVSLMPLAEILHALKIAPEINQAEWTFEDAEGKRFSLNLAAQAPDVKIEWLSTLKEIPLYREKSNELMWTTVLPEAQTVYLNLKSYPDAETFKRVSAEAFKLIDGSGAKRLVIDVRQSNGGDFFKFRSHILKELKNRAAFRKPTSLFIIIGRATISAAMVNAIETRDEMNAILVGEPSGSKPNSYSENDQLTLPNSRVKISYSTKYYKFQDKDTPSLMPDKLIEPVWELYTAGRDSVMEWILAQPLPK